MRNPVLPLADVALTIERALLFARPEHRADLEALRVSHEELRRRIEKVQPGSTAVPIPPMPTLGARCPSVAPPGHDCAGQQCGNHAGHDGPHTALVASAFLEGLHVMTSRPSRLPRENGRNGAP